jgi:hypothetical protein
MNKPNYFSGFVPASTNPTEIEAVVGASFFITPKAFEKIGLFNERYFMYFEDLDYCKKVMEKGLKVVYIPEIYLFHHHGLSGKNVSVSEPPNKNLIASSKIYHGIIKYYLINFVLWSGQLIQRIIK